MTVFSSITIASPTFLVRTSTGDPFVRNDFFLMYHKAVDRDRLASPVARALAQGFGPGRASLREAFQTGRTVLGIRHDFGESLIAVCRLRPGVKLFNEPPDPTSLFYKTVCPGSPHR
jgi:hypothetical protein